ncbi:MAG: alanine--glyoxylate aminotransferase family protein [Candidatus Omnitrophica bacterium]|nr:alanine--glyoxylate aminotransferase family protein [Candidatus Omnitrophota bacterium]
MKESLLLTPGPTNVPAGVLGKTALPMIHHRTKEFQAVLERVNANLQKVFLTRHPVMTFASSGTGAMEASVTNLLSRNDQVLSFSAGKWGERYRDIARVYGMDVKVYAKASGEAFSAAEVGKALDDHPRAKAALITLCETSTGVRHPIQEIAAVTSKSGAMLFVDAISGLLCDPLRMDEWGVDVVVCGSQKGFMLPPGLSFVAVNERAQRAIAGSDLPKYYFNFSETIKMIKKNDTPFTPAVGLIRGLDEALGMILAEGVENVWRRHAEVARWVRREMSSLGLALLATAPSDALTAVRMPEGIVSGDAIKVMRDSHGVVMADGQGELKGKIIRFAHMGAACTMDDARRGFGAFCDAMSKAGFKPPSLKPVKE